MKKKIRFIINPISGRSQKSDLSDLIKKHVDKNQFDIEIALTEGPKHGSILSHDAAEKNFDLVVSVGGDGSANEVASGLMGSKTPLAFIAVGSGNGMSRHLKIPMNFEKAMQVINTGRVIKIDTMKVNESFCLGIMGVGFDAHVAHLFAASPKRGFSTYAKLVLKEFYRYTSENFEFTIDNKLYNGTCFLLSIANASQFGNNAVIAPFANVQDGLMEVSVLKPFPGMAALSLVYRLMNRSIQRSKFFFKMQGKNLVLKNNKELKAHIDGEPVTYFNDLHIQILPSSLNVLVPSNYS